MSGPAHAPRPPRVAQWLLRLLVPPEDREYVLGDLEADYRRRAAISRTGAALRYWHHVAQSLGPALAEQLRGRRHARKRAHAPPPDDGLRKGEPMNALLQDVRFALRMLRRGPLFAAVTVTTLAIGIGANTAIFSVMRGVLLRPLPYHEPGQLGVMYVGWDEIGSDRTNKGHELSEPEVYDFRRGITPWRGSRRTTAQRSTSRATRATRSG